MAEVRLHNISKVFDKDVIAVDHVSFTVNDEEFVVLVGPSGCGKSTALRMIAGLETISEGDIYIGGRLVNDVPPKDRDIAMVFQNYALYPHMTVFENMAFGLKLRKYPKKEIEKQIDEAAKIVGLEDLLHRRPKALSGGQRQRVAVGRAIVRRPKVFLFDEPLSNLDAKLRVQMRFEISRLHKELGATMIYVTHDQTEAMTMADRIVVLKDGLVQQVDTPINMYNQPQNKCVAGFIGSPAMNFMEGIINSKGVFQASDNAFSLPLEDDRFAPLRNHKITIGIRPEDIHASNPLTQAHFSPFQAGIKLIEPMGNETFLHFSIGNKKMIARTKPDVSFPQGQSARLYIDLKKLHFFDPETGVNIKE